MPSSLLVFGWPCRNISKGPGHLSGRAAKTDSSCPSKRTKPKLLLSFQGPGVVLLLFSFHTQLIYVHIIQVGSSVFGEESLCWSVVGGADVFFHLCRWNPVTTASLRTAHDLPLIPTTGAPRGASFCESAIRLIKLGWFLLLVVESCCFNFYMPFNSNNSNECQTFAPKPNPKGKRRCPKKKEAPNTSPSKKALLSCCPPRWLALSYVAGPGLLHMSMEIMVLAMLCTTGTKKKSKEKT